MIKLLRSVGAGEGGILSVGIELVHQQIHSRQLESETTRGQGQLQFTRVQNAATDRQSLRIILSIDIHLVEEIVGARLNIERSGGLIGVGVVWVSLRRVVGGLGSYTERNQTTTSTSRDSERGRAPEPRAVYAHTGREDSAAGGAL